MAGRLHDPAPDIPVIEPAVRRSIPLLALRGVSKCFGPTHALVDVDLDLGRGEIVALMGANGAGKSTLVSILGGSTRPDGGRITLEGRPLAVGSPSESSRSGIAVVHQATDRAGVPGLTVADALVLDRLAAHGSSFFVSRRGIRRQATAIAGKAGFDLPLDRDFAELRPAERQLVAIARAIAAEAGILIMDEPTASLSASESQHLFALLEKLRQRGLGILYVSHRLTDLQRLADRVIVLRGGRVALSQARPIDFEAAVTAMIGRPVASARADARAATGDPMIAIRSLRSGPTSAPIDLDVGWGEVVAITGPLGAGKSRLLRTIFGVHAAADGMMLLAGAPYRPNCPSDAIAAGVAMAGEDRHQTSFVPSDWPGGTVEGTIALPHLRRWFPDGFVRTGRETQVAVDAIRRLGIRAPGPRARLDTLSGGNQQKTVLARWQAEPTRLLLLDEPFQGVDVGARADIIAAIRAERDGATLIATSDPEEALEVADRILFMDRGTLAPWSAVEALRSSGASSQEHLS